MAHSDGTAARAQTQLTLWTTGRSLEEFSHGERIGGRVSSREVWHAWWSHGFERPLGAAGEWWLEGSTVAGVASNAGTETRQQKEAQYAHPSKASQCARQQCVGLFEICIRALHTMPGALAFCHVPCRPCRAGSSFEKVSLQTSDLVKVCGPPSCPPWLRNFVPVRLDHS